MEESNIDRLKRFATEDWRRLADEETWEETLFSLALCLTVFAALFGLMELGIHLNRR